MWNPVIALKSIVSFLVPLYVIFLSASASFSLTPKQVSQKLDVVLVFLIAEKVNNEYKMMFFNNASGFVSSPWFLTRKSAEAFKSTIKTKKMVEIISLPLPKAQGAFEETAALPDNKNKIFKAPLYAADVDAEEATKILLAEGYTLEQIRQGVQVPVFYTEPMAVVSTSNGAKKAYFFSYKQMQDRLKSLSGVDTKDLKIKVADLNVVLAAIAKSEKDEFIFHPTPAYIKADPSILLKE